MKKKTGAWQRRHAIQIVAQLPECVGDALMVLDLARELIESFLSEEPQRPRVVPLADANSSKARSASSSSILNLNGTASTLPDRSHS